MPTRPSGDEKTSYNGASCRKVELLDKVKPGPIENGIEFPAATTMTTAMYSGLQVFPGK